MSQFLSIICIMYLEASDQPTHVEFSPPKI